MFYGSRIKPTCRSFDPEALDGQADGLRAVPIPDFIAEQIVATIDSH